MMNKPDGVVSATYDNRDETVIDLLEVEHQVFEPFLYNDIYIAEGFWCREVLCQYDWNICKWGT